MVRKILFYTHAFGGGGAEIVFARLAGRFAASGDDVVFAADHQGPEAAIDRANLRHVLLPVGHIASTRALAGLLRRERPDASFSALGAQNLKHLAAAAATGRLERCVLGYHGFAKSEPKRLSRLSFLATPLSTRLAARTICVSDALLADVRDRWHGSRCRTLRIHNPASAGSAPVARRAESPPLIVAVGRLIPAKRFADLVAALAKVQPADARLAILGAGPERGAIEAAVARHGLGHRVLLTGYVDDPSLWYRRASCLAIASEKESFGLTAAEALTHGVPVVTTDCGGPPEILEGGRLGRIVPVGDVEAMAKALSATLETPGDDDARRARAADFTVDTIHRAYADLIGSLP
jgi:glycosyltransferase involved in cell wall biosynthesis